MLFGKEAATKIQESVKALEILFTEDSDGWVNSRTAKEAIQILDNLAKAGKYFGSDVFAGAVEQVVKLNEAGAAGRIAREVMQGPVEEVQAGMQRGQTLQSLGRKTAAGSLTLGGMRPDETQR